MSVLDALSVVQQVGTFVQQCLQILEDNGGACKELSGKLDHAQTTIALVRPLTLRPLQKELRALFTAYVTGQLELLLQSRKGKFVTLIDGKDRIKALQAFGQAVEVATKNLSESLQTAATQNAPGLEHDGAANFVKHFMPSGSCAFDAFVRGLEVETHAAISATDRALIFDALKAPPQGPVTVAGGEAKDGKGKAGKGAPAGAAAAGAGAGTAGPVDVSVVTTADLMIFLQHMRQQPADRFPLPFAGVSAASAYPKSGRLSISIPEVEWANRNSGNLIKAHVKCRLLKNPSLIEEDGHIKIDKKAGGNWGDKDGALPTIDFAKPLGMTVNDGTVLNETVEVSVVVSGKGEGVPMFHVVFTIGDLFDVHPLFGLVTKPGAQRFESVERGSFLRVNALFAPAQVMQPPTYADPNKLADAKDNLKALSLGQVFEKYLSGARRPAYVEAAGLPDPSTVELERRREAAKAEDIRQLALAQVAAQAAAAAAAAAAAGAAGAGADAKKDTKKADKKDNKADKKADKKDQKGGDSDTEADQIVDLRVLSATELSKINRKMLSRLLVLFGRRVWLTQEHTAMEANLAKQQADLAVAVQTIAHKEDGIASYADLMTRSVDAKNAKAKAALEAELPAWRNNKKIYTNNVAIRTKTVAALAAELAKLQTYVHEIASQPGIAKPVKQCLLSNGVAEAGGDCKKWRDKTWIDGLKLLRAELVDDPHPNPAVPDGIIQAMQKMSDDLQFAMTKGFQKTTDVLGARAANATPVVQGAMSPASPVSPPPQAQALDADGDDN